MQMTERSKALLEIFRQGLSHIGIVQINQNLGDRQSYIGVSDISQYVECPRKAIASKLYPIKEDLSSQLALQRGHSFEKGVGNSLGSAENGGELIKPHPMFRFVATANTNGGGDETGLYHGVQGQNLAFADRFMLCDMTYLTSEVKKITWSKISGSV